MTKGFPRSLNSGRTAFVALFRLPEKRSLLAFDEPELHLHPRLVLRVLGFFEKMALESPVILATHSDQLLDGLNDPAGSVVLSELAGEGWATILRRPDPYKGKGIRYEGEQIRRKVGKTGK